MVTDTSGESHYGVETKTISYNIDVYRYFELVQPESPTFLSPAQIQDPIVCPVGLAPLEDFGTVLKTIWSVPSDPYSKTSSPKIATDNYLHLHLKCTFTDTNGNQAVPVSCKYETKKSFIAVSDKPFLYETPSPSQPPQPAAPVVTESPSLSGILVQSLQAESGELNPQSSIPLVQILPPSLSPVSTPLPYILCPDSSSPKTMTIARVQQLARSLTTLSSAIGKVLGKSYDKGILLSKLIELFEPRLVKAQKEDDALKSKSSASYEILVQVFKRISSSTDTLASSILLVEAVGVLDLIRQHFVHTLWTKSIKKTVDEINELANQIFLNEQIMALTLDGDIDPDCGGIPAFIFMLRKHWRKGLLIKVKDSDDLLKIPRDILAEVSGDKPLERASEQLAQHKSTVCKENNSKLDGETSQEILAAMNTISSGLSAGGQFKKNSALPSEHVFGNGYRLRFFDQIDIIPKSGDVYDISFHRMYELVHSDPISPVWIPTLCPSDITAAKFKPTGRDILQVWNHGISTIPSHSVVTSMAKVTYSLKKGRAKHANVNVVSSPSLVPQVKIPDSDNICIAGVPGDSEKSFIRIGSLGSHDSSHTFMDALVSLERQPPAEYLKPFLLGAVRHEKIIRESVHPTVIETIRDVILNDILVSTSTQGETQSILIMEVVGLLELILEYVPPLHGPAPVIPNPIYDMANKIIEDWYMRNQIMQTASGDCSGFSALSKLGVPATDPERVSKIFSVSAARIWKRITDTSGNGSLKDDVDSIVTKATQLLQNTQTADIKSVLCMRVCDQRYAKISFTDGASWIRLAASTNSQLGSKRQEFIKYSGIPTDVIISHGDQRLRYYDIAQVSGTSDKYNVKFERIFTLTEPRGVDGPCTNELSDHMPAVTDLQSLLQNGSSHDIKSTLHDTLKSLGIAETYNRVSVSISCTHESSSAQMSCTILDGDIDSIIPLEFVREKSPQIDLCVVPQVVTNSGGPFIRAGELGAIDSSVGEPDELIEMDIQGILALSQPGPVIAFLAPLLQTAKHDAGSISTKMHSSALFTLHDVMQNIVKKGAPSDTRDEVLLLELLGIFELVKSTPPSRSQFEINHLINVLFSSEQIMTVSDQCVGIASLYSELKKYVGNPPLSPTQKQKESWAQLTSQVLIAIMDNMSFDGSVRGESYKQALLEVKANMEAALTTISHPPPVAPLQNGSPHGDTSPRTSPISGSSASLTSQTSLQILSAHELSIESKGDVSSIIPDPLTILVAGSKARDGAILKQAPGASSIHGPNINGSPPLTSSAYLHQLVTHQLVTQQPNGESRGIKSPRRAPTSASSQPSPRESWLQVLMPGESDIGPNHDGSSTITAPFSSGPSIQVPGMTLEGVVSHTLQEETNT